MDKSPRIKRHRLNIGDWYDGTNVEILRGDFTHLSNRIGSEIRIYICSIFKDFEVERNYLVEHVYDELRKSCVEKYQKDLIFVDMNWGVTDEFINQEKTTELCLNEIKCCQEISIGPSFVALLGNRYGPRTYKHLIDANEFDLLKKEVKKVSNKDAARKLESSYEFDNNLKKYKLNVSKTLKWEWKLNEDKLLKTIRKAVENFSKNTSVSQQQKDLYLTSAIDQEIQMGLSNDFKTISDHKTSNYKFIAFFRELENLGSSEIAESYRENDLEVKILLSDLKHSVKSTLTATNKYFYQLDWSKANNLNEPFTETMQEYLKKFAEDFKFTIKLLVQWNIEAAGVLKDDPEVVNHARMCIHLQKNYLNRPSYLRKIQAYFKSESTEPIILVGPPGSGKSTFIAQAAKFAKEENNSIVIVRFMGSTKESSKMNLVFNSIVNHLNAIFKHEKPIDDITQVEGLFEIRDKFLKQLRLISNRFPNVKIFILLDSIEKLARRDYSLDWLFFELPENVKVIFSLQIDQEILYEIIKGKLSCIKIDNLDQEEAKTMFKLLLDNSNRQLSKKQWHSIEELFIFSREIYPLHVKLIFDIAAKWLYTYEVDEDFMKCVNIKETIKYLYKNYEKTFGETLFSHCVFYISFFEFRGISESELLDILSIDDDVLNSVYKSYHPSVRRFPIALWLNIKYDLKDYLIEREIDGVVVISWIHKLFIETAKDYYESIFLPSMARDRLIMNIIDYFTERWCEHKSNGKRGDLKVFFNKKKKLNLNLKFKSIQHGKRVEYMAHRNTKLQRLKFYRQLENGEFVYYNERKLNELPYAICMLNDNFNKIELLKEYVYYNAEFMQAKAELHDLDFVVDIDENILSNLRFDYGDELRDLSEISYLFLNFQQKLYSIPKCLPIEVVSKLGNRTMNIRKFASNSGLVLQHNYATNEPFRELYRIHDESLIVNFYYLCSCYIFIETQTEPYSITKLSIINYMNLQFVGQLDFEMKAQSLQIILDNQNFTTIQTMTDLSGFIYFRSFNYIYSMNFRGEIVTVLKLVEDIRDLFLVHQNYMITVFGKSLVLLDLKKNNRVATIHEKLVFNDEIEYVKINIKSNETMSLDFFNKIDNVMILVAFKSMTINIYQFKKVWLKLCCSIDDIIWEPYSAVISVNSYLISWRDTLIIDESSLIDSSKSSVVKKIFRFAIEGNGLVLIVSITNDGNYSITDRIDRTSFGEFTSDAFAQKIDLIRFFNNKIVLSVNTETGTLNSACVFIYDIDTRICLKLDSLQNTNYVSYIYEPSILTVVQSSELFTFEVRDTKIKMLSKLKADVSCIKIKHNQLIGICNKGRTLNEIDYTFNSMIDTTSSLNINNILFQFSSKFIFVELKSDDTSRELAIIDVVSLRRLKSFIVSNSYIILGVNSNFLVLYDTSYFFLNVYKIMQKEGRFHLNLKIKERVDIGVKKTKTLIGNFYLVESNMSILIALFNREKNRFEIGSIEPIEMSDDLKYNGFIVNIDKVEINHDDMKCTFTSANHFLVVWEHKKNKIYYFHIFNNQLLMVNDELDALECVYNIVNTNDFILKSRSEIFSIHFNTYTNELRKHRIKDFNNNSTINFLLGLHGEFVWIRLVDKINSFEVYRLEKFLKGMRPDLIISNSSVSTFCFSKNFEYLIIFTSDFELKVYRIDLKNSFASSIKRTACLFLNHKLDNLFASENYINARYGKKLLTFEIVFDD